MSKWIIHIGYQKTGTTWLQKMVFPRLGNIVYHGKHGDTPLPWLSELIAELKRHPFHRDLSGMRKKIDRIENEYNENTTHVLSCEGFVGTPVLGGIDAEHILNGVFDVFRNPKIIVTIRNQMALMVSLYKQYVLAGGTLTPYEYFNVTTPSNRFSLEFLCFDRMISHLTEKTGGENVLVLPLESIQQNRQKAINRLCAFVGVSPLSMTNEHNSVIRQGNPDIKTYHLRRLNHFCPSLMNPSGGMFVNSFLSKWILALIKWGISLEERRDTFYNRPRTILDDDDKKRFRSIFADSNRNLQKLVSDDLSELGYSIK